ncbi:hypothetical protein D3C73_1190980 [compost metagenome]
MVYAVFCRQHTCQLYSTSVRIQTDLRQLVLDCFTNARRTAVWVFIRSELDDFIKTKLSLHIFYWFTRLVYRQVYNMRFR